MALNKATFPVLSGTGVVLEAVPGIDPYDSSDTGRSGTTAQRPTTTSMFDEYFDTDLMLVIYWHQRRATWTDQMGNAV